MRVILTAFSTLLLGTAALAQTPTPEEVLAKVNERVAMLNPYQELLNDPDPARSLAAMEIMLESGDANLIRTAMEFGLLSPNPQVQRAALEGLMRTEPVLPIRLDASGMVEGWFSSTVQNNLGGTVSPEGIGFASLAFGPYDKEWSCFKWKGSEECGMTITADGILIKSSALAAQMKLAENGQLIGSASLYSVAAPVPVSIQLFE